VRGSFFGEEAALEIGIAGEAGDQIPILEAWERVKGASPQRPVFADPQQPVAHAEEPAPPREGAGKPPPEPFRSSRIPFRMTASEVPISAATAIHSVA
jgi:hypothetical protein